MKKTCIALALLAIASTAAAEEAKKGELTAAAALERLKSLAGTWGGESPEAGAFEVHYSVVGGGSAVAERLFPGGHHEMLTVYHLDGDDLVATHYCTAGNQTKLALDRVESTAGELRLAFAGGSNLDNGRPHVGGARLTFVDADHLVADWRFVAKAGDAPSSVRFALARR
jgi:hypothetical protein